MELQVPSVKPMRDCGMLTDVMAVSLVLLASYHRTNYREFKLSIRSVGVPKSYHDTVERSFVGF